MKKQKKITPLMQQFHDLKKDFSDSLLFFQVGDFYELFFDDAKKASAFLGITLTTRGKHLDEEVPLCGVPVHALNHYLIKLVKGGFKVAICDQLESPQPGKVVKRGVTNILTPGTLTDEALLDEKSASYLCACFSLGKNWGLAFAEMLTGQLFVTHIEPHAFKDIERELARFLPDEVVLPKNASKKLYSFFAQQGFYVSSLDMSIIHDDRADQWIKVLSKKETRNIDQSVLILLYGYLEKNASQALKQFKQVHFYQTDDYLIMDAATLRHLEIITNAQDGGRKNTLFALLDDATTAMGSRMIKKWLVRPLIKQESIDRRLDVIQYLGNHWHITQDIRSLLKNIGDIERVIGRIGIHRALVHDYIRLKHALSYLPALKSFLSQHKQIALLATLDVMIQDFSELYLLLQDALHDDEQKDWIIKQGFDKHLNELRQLIHNSNTLIIQLEQKEQEKTGISSLKIRFNQVHGYYIEVTKPNVHLVPDYYKRYQTLVAKERFITAELKDLESKIIEAQTKIKQVEQDIFNNIKAEVTQHISSLRLMAQALAHMDALCAFTSVSYNLDYTRPIFNNNRDIIIEQGRHPVVEKHLSQQFIPNDARLTDAQSLWLITGPNMGGKSTYLRQAALISILAQCGMFVPAKSANLPILDRIFTRIGASDNVAEGKSTFLVEMEETADICNNATKNSLVILDEIGRGTSTFDGLAIAQAVVEYLYTTIQARCLFATHYHELTLLKDRFTGIACFYVASKKTADGILLLHKIKQGIADGSFGIDVAKLAGLPNDVISRSKEIAKSLEQKESLFIPSQISNNAALIQENQQLRSKLDILEGKQYQTLIETLEVLDFDDLSPKKAFDILWKMKDSGF